MRGGELVKDLVDAVRGGPDARTRCDVDEMRRLTEIGFALHESSRAGGALVTMPLPERESIHVDSRRWGSDHLKRHLAGRKPPTAGNILREGTTPPAWKNKAPSTCCRNSEHAVSEQI